MLYLKHSKVVKYLSSSVLFFFLWTFGGICDLAYAIDNITKDNPKSKIQSSKSVKQKPEEKFQKAIEEIENIISDASAETFTAKGIETKKKNLKTKKTELESLDKEIREQFAETEKKLKEANLPEKMLQRHYTFVKHYEDNLKELNANLDSVEVTKDQEHTDAIEKTKTYLQKIRPPKKHKALDPNKLPHRTAQPIKKEPRLKQEEFDKEFKVQKAEYKQKKQILIASGGSLDGLLSKNTDYTTQDTDSIISRFNLKNSAMNAENYMLLAQATPPSQADLSETIEVKFTPEIIAKAQELGNNPVKIYEYVKNNFFFEPYYGSLKGAQETLLEKAGNDFDQASLLIAFLRVSNIPSRYVYGTIEIPIDKVKKWFGVENDLTAGEMFATNGVPVKLVSEGGKITKVQIEHVWVEAWVSYDNYRGQPNSQNKTWIPLDPSFKQVQYTKGPDIKQIINFDPDTFMDEVMAHSTYNTSDYSVSHVDESFIQQKLQEYQSSLSNYVANNIPNAKPQDLVGKFDILYEKFGILPATLPYKVIVNGTNYSEIPDSVRHKLKIEIRGIDYLQTSNITYQSNLSQLAGKKITISYLPSTSADENTLRNYEVVSSVPAYLVNMKPVLMIDGTAVATGQDIGLGKIQKIDLTFSSPNIQTDIASHNLTAGGYHAIGIDLQRIPKELMQKQTDRMQAMKTYLESILSGTPSTPPPGDSRDNLLGDILYDVAINYFYNLNALNDFASRLTDIMWIKQSSEAMVFIDIKIDTIFDMPLFLKPAGISIDVDRNIIAPFSMDGDKKISNAFMMVSGNDTSAMEHTILERFFKIESVSTAKVLQTANLNSMPVYFITPDNINQILPVLNVSSSVKNEIQNSIAAGNCVMIPQSEIQLNDWAGTGYIILNPITLASSYRISGNINGGSTTCDPNSSNPWSQLCPVVGDLLSFSLGLMGPNQAHTEFIQRIYASISNLILEMNPNVPAEIIDKAEAILESFLFYTVYYVKVMGVSIKLMEAINLVGGLGLGFFYKNLDVVIETLSETIFHYTVFETFYQASRLYIGAFVAEYTYEYIVLFSADLINAFP